MKFGRHVIFGLLCGFGTINAHAEPLPANPWGNAALVASDTASEQETKRKEAAEAPISSGLTANPWAANNTQRFRYSEPQKAETFSDNNNMSAPTITVTISENKPKYGGIIHAAPQENSKEGSGMFDGLFDANTKVSMPEMPKMPEMPEIPSFSTPSVSKPSANDFKVDDMLPDFDKIKRNSTRKFNEVTAPIKKSAKEAKDFFEKGSGVKLNEVFK
jgi:hypothetical protein